MEFQSQAAWPALPYESWRDTCTTLHLWLQMAGKVRIGLSPHLNHGWRAAFYLTARGLTNAAIPQPGGAGVFDLEFDLIAHRLRLRTSRGGGAELELRSGPIAEFYAEFIAALRGLGIEVHLWPMPVEMPNPVRFDLDRTHFRYDPDWAQRWWRSLTAVEPVLQEFRGRFLGKCSPVHLFFGSMDLAVTRFSGRPAPERAGADASTRDAYSHEVISVGYWPGDESFPQAAFYAYAAPAPAGLAECRLAPAGAVYDSKLGEFILPYETVRQANDPRLALLEFCQSSYEAGARLGKWDRAQLEYPPAQWPK